MSSPYDKARKTVELFYENFPKCPLCKSDADYEFSGWTCDYAQCEWCKAKWLLREGTMKLVEASTDQESRSVMGLNLLGKSLPVSFWQKLDISRLRAKEEKLGPNRMSSVDINDYERAIERLTILFSKGEINEESYMKAIKTIEEKLNKLRKKTTECPQCGKEVPIKFKLCPHCGFDWRPTPPSLSPYTPYVEKPTSWWYLVPFLLGLIGGVLGYIVVKDEDKEMAETLLVIGIVMSFIGILVIWAIYSYYLSMLSRLL